MKNIKADVTQPTRNRGRLCRCPVHSIVERFGSKFPLVPTAHCCNMLQTALTLAQSLLDDHLTDDDVFLYDIIDVVPALFLCFPEKLQISGPWTSRTSGTCCFLSRARRKNMKCGDRNRTTVVSMW